MFESNKSHEKAPIALKDSSFLLAWNMEEEWRLRCHFLVGGGQQEVKRSRRPCLGCKRRTTRGQFPDQCVWQKICTNMRVATFLMSSAPSCIYYIEGFQERKPPPNHKMWSRRRNRRISRRRITRPASIPRAACSAVCEAEEYLGQASCPGFAAIRSRAVISTQVTCYTFYKCKCTTTRITTNKRSMTSAATTQKTTVLWSSLD